MIRTVSSGSTVLFFCFPRGVGINQSLLLLVSFNVRWIFNRSLNPFGSEVSLELNIRLLASLRAGLYRQTNGMTPRLRTVNVAERRIHFPPYITGKFNLHPDRRYVYTRSQKRACGTYCL